MRIIVSSVLLAAASACAVAAGPAKNADADSLTVVAEIALERGDCRAAADAYASAAQKSKGPDLARRATQVAVTCEQLPAARRAIDTWLALEPRSADALRVAAVLALKQRRLPAASDLLSKYLALEPERFERALLELLPIAESEAGARDTAQVIGQLKPDSAYTPATLTELAEASFRAFDFATAQRRIERVLTADPKLATAHRLDARLRAAQGEADRALAAARRAATLAPESQSFALAETLIELQRHEEAHRELERLAAAEATRSDASRRLALLAFTSGDNAEARRRFADVIAARDASNEASAEATLFLGFLAERAGEPDTALDYYRELIGGGAGLLVRRRAAKMLLTQGARDEAMKLLDEYSKGQPGRAVETETARADLLAEAGFGTDAVRTIEAAIAKHPQHPALEYQRAILLERAGRTRESIRAFEAILKARADDPEVLNALGYTLADRGQQLSRAERLVRRALASAPDNPAILDSLGWVRYRRRASAEALPLLERAYRISREAEIAAHWGEVLWTSGDQAKARTVWAGALARDPDSEPLKKTVARFLPPAKT